MTCRYCVVAVLALLLLARSSNGQPDLGFKKLSEDELKEHYSYCGYKSPPRTPPPLSHAREATKEGEFSSDANQPLSLEERIVNGKIAKNDPLQYPAAVSLSITTKNGTSRCGGALITWQHIITASHCFQLRKFKTGDRLIIVAGDTCDQLSRRFCPSAGYYQEVLEFRRVYWRKEWQVAYEYNSDLAIIQLKEPLPYEARSRIHFACLKPLPRVPLPTRVWITGWGPNNDEYRDDASRLLRHAEVDLDPSLATRYQQCHVEGLLCTAPILNRTAIPRPGTRPGDSGNGVYYVEPKTKLRRLLAIHSVRIPPYLDLLDGHADLTQHYEELCYYINLCLPGHNATKAKIDYDKWDEGKMKFDRLAFNE